MTRRSTTTAATATATATLPLLLLSALLLLGPPVPLAEAKSTKAVQSLRDVLVRERQAEGLDKPKQSKKAKKKEKKGKGKKKKKEEEDGEEKKEEGTMVLPFVSIGDWGYPTKCLKNNAKAMGEWASENRAQFVISTGDNFYWQGVKSVDDAKWDTCYENVFRDKSLQVPWYVVLGNHDSRGSIDAQIEYSKKSQRWKLPKRWYTETYEIEPKLGVTLQVVYIDTTYKTNPKNKRDQEVGIGRDKDGNQLKWLEKTLKASDAHWLIVVGHHPIYSGGPNGGFYQLVDKVRPLLVKYQVDMYLCGHDHGMQHLSDKKLEYVVSGGGSQHTTYNAIDESKYGSAVCGWTAHEASLDKLTTTLYDQHGKKLHSFSISPRRRTSGK